jgi:hypothetical protein
VADERLRLEHVGEHTASNDGTEHDGPERDEGTQRMVHMNYDVIEPSRFPQLVSPQNTNGL